MPPESVSRFREDGMHQNKACRPKVCSGFGGRPASKQNSKPAARALFSRDRFYQKFSRAAEHNRMCLPPGTRHNLLKQIVIFDFLAAPAVNHGDLATASDPVEKRGRTYDQQGR
jgi:hypothetical protein